MRTTGRITRGIRATILAAAACATLALTLLTINEGLADDSVSTRPAATTQPVATIQPAAFERAYIIPIIDEITDVTYDSLKRRLDGIRDQNPDLIIIELDTPGGMLVSTLDICNELKAWRDEGVAVYAWVNDTAYSAGTIIALATDGIIVSSARATIGDCQPIQMGPGGASSIPEDIEPKATSPLLAELRDSIRRNGYNHDMVLSLIRPEMEMFWVENAETGERKFVETRERDKLFGLGTRAKKASESKERSGLLGLFGGDDSDDEDDEDDELISDELSKTAWRYVRSCDELEGEIQQPIVSHRELLTMKGDVAEAYGFLIATLGSEDELRSHFNITGSIVRLENNWLEIAIEWLASPMVRGVLFLLMLLGAYTEFQTPGFGVAGAVALVALVIFLGAPYLAGYVVTWEIVAIVLGVVLLAVEAFVIPGFGIAGISGLILLAVGLIASFMPEEPTFDKDWLPTWPTVPNAWQYFERGLYSLAGGLVGSIVGMVLIAKYFPKVPVAGRIIAPNPDHDAIQIDDPYEGVARIGDIGLAESLLRPAGKARFGPRLVDVVSEGEYIQGGSRVEVVERHGNRVVVRRVD